MNVGYAADSHFHPRMEKIMKNTIRVTFALALLCAALSTASLASSIYIVQGVAGRNFAEATDPAFPVDVLLNDEVCYVHGLAYGTISGPLTFFPGTHNIKVSIANTLAPCTEAPLIDSNVTLDKHEDLSAVITLDPNGKPALVTFVNNMTPVAAGMGRVLLAQAADAPALQVTLQNIATNKVYKYTVNPGALLDVTLPAGAYNATISQGGTTFIASSPVDLFSQSATLLYTIGEATNNTLNLVSRSIRNVI
jgi:hypothetical protein